MHDQCMLQWNSPAPMELIVCNTPVPSKPCLCKPHLLPPGFHLYRYVQCTVVDHWQVYHDSHPARRNSSLITTGINQSGLGIQTHLSAVIGYTTTTERCPPFIKTGESIYGRCKSNSDWSLMDRAPWHKLMNKASLCKWYKLQYHHSSAGLIERCKISFLFENFRALSCTWFLMHFNSKIISCMDCIGLYLPLHAQLLSISIIFIRKRNNRDFLTK